MSGLPEEDLPHMDHQLPITLLFAEDQKMTKRLKKHLTLVSVV
jgi:hypothetical protein